jgi:DNA repair exonuclease SbcCD ATPase subunit
MNVDLYLFGDFGNGYTQYIDDNTRVKFKSFVEKAKAKSQLIINRDDALIYYTYIRRLHSEGSSNVKYIGISYVLNTHFIQDIDGLFEILEGAVTTIASRGIILKYLPSGQVTTNVEKIYQAKAEFAHISAYLKSELDAFMVDKKCKLPTLDFSINTSELKTFKFTDPREDIIKSISTFPTVYIYKDRNYENEESKSFSSTLSKLNKEKTAALQTIDKQKQEIIDLKKQQKNYKLVIWLVIFICVGGLICYISIKNKDADIVRLQNNVANQEQTIASQSQTIDILRDTVAVRNRKIQTLKTNIHNLEHKRDSLIRSNRTLTTEKNTLINEKSNLTTKLNRTESTLKDANAKISKKDNEIQKLNSEVSKYKYAKKEPEKYKTKYKAVCYYKDGNYQYKKTGDYYARNTTVSVYYTTYKYALTEKGYVLLSDLQKVY